MDWKNEETRRRLMNSIELYILTDMRDFKIDQCHFCISSYKQKTKRVIGVNP